MGKVIDVLPYLSQKVLRDNDTQTPFTASIDKLPWTRWVQKSDIDTIIINLDKVIHDFIPATLVTKCTLKSDSDIDYFVDEFNGLAARLELKSYFNWYKIDNIYECNVIFYKYPSIGITLDWHFKDMDYPHDSLPVVISGLLLGSPASAIEAYLQGTVDEELEEE